MAMQHKYVITGPGQPGHLISKLDFKEQELVVYGQEDIMHSNVRKLTHRKGSKTEVSELKAGIVLSIPEFLL